MDDGTGKREVTIFTRKFTIKGNLNIFIGIRLTDYMNESKNFISVTDAEVKNQNGEVVLSAEFLNVRKDEIEIIVPEDMITKTTE